VENRGRLYRNQRLVNVVDVLLVIGSRLKHRLGLSSSVNMLAQPLRKMKQAQLTDAHEALLSSAMLNELREAFAPDIALLSRLIGQDLSYWLDSAG